jgi:pSer/pThr/pTyr-binding forkhead associated (FHA) protein
MVGSVSTGENSKTIGREASCELSLEHPTVSRFHARIELANDGFVSLLDTGSRNGTFLNRGDSWIRFKRVTLCIGDRIRFGELEIPLERLTAVFGNRSNARLEARHFLLRQGNKRARSFADRSDPGPLLQKPRRNPVTGKIEEDHAG